MTELEASRIPPGFKRNNARRAFIIIGTLVVAGACYWFMLPIIQSLIIPKAPGGRNGPWVVRPILAFRFGAAAVMSLVTVFFATRPLQRIWRREDAALGIRSDPFDDKPVKRALSVFTSFLPLAIYALSLVFYMFSWTIIGPDGIEESLPWTTRNHSFQDIVSLETIPDGEWSESIQEFGPWFSISFKDGRHITLSKENEGSTLDELSAMTTFIADRSGLVWARRRDARAR